MDFLKEFSKQFSNITRSAGEKSKEGAEVTRLNGELKAAEESLESLYTRFGKVSYALRSGRGDPDAAEELALRIRATALQVDELTAARDAALEWKRCPGCGALFPREARFCSACGKKLPEHAPRPEPVEVGEFCPNCGAKRENDEPRCPVCGHDYDAPPAPEPAPAPEPVIAGPDPEEPDGAME